jgi:hypothetical protein
VGNLEGRLLVLLGLNEGANKGLSEDGDEDDGVIVGNCVGILDGDDADKRRGGMTINNTYNISQTSD